VPLHVAAVSGSRADFGPLRPLLVALDDDPRFVLSSIVCAVAGEVEARRQVEAFAASGLGTAAVVTMVDGQSAGPAPMGSQAARALAGVSDALDRSRPDLVVVLGDRFEILAAALAAHLLRIPLVHLSGGDETLGSLDDAMRHAISRLASLHLPTNEEAAGRLRALGIPEGRIRTVGSTALDALTAFQPLPRADLSASVGIDLTGTVVAVSYHAATQSDEPPATTMRAILAAVRDVAPDAAIVITGSNADEGGSSIDAVATEVAASDPRAVLVPTLGHERYWSLLHVADVLVGNSSSALIEAPVTGVPVVDVGVRQRSRLRSSGCLHAPAERSAIADALLRALDRGRAAGASPYGDGGAVPRILELLATIDPAALLQPVPLAPVPAAHDVVPR
jgi:UDP-hydrolysing UDP-N-acetyl-D-glucosamine 2-epimerase